MSMVSWFHRIPGVNGFQGCQNAPATGAIASYSEVFAGCKLLEKREKKRIKKKL